MTDAAERHTNELDIDDPILAQAGLKNPSKLYVWGVSTAPAQKRMSQETPHWTVEDLADIDADAVGRPIFRDHTVSEPLGRVLKTWATKENQVAFVLELEDTPQGHGMYNEIRSGKMHSVSWGARHQVVNDSKLVRAVADKRVVELSVTDNPEFSDAKIMGYTERDDNHAYIRQKLLEFVKTPAGAETFGARAAQYLGTCITGQPIFFINRNSQNTPATASSHRKSNPSEKEEMSTETTTANTTAAPATPAVATPVAAAVAAPVATSPTTPTVSATVLAPATQAKELPRFEKVTNAATGETEFIMHPTGTLRIMNGTGQTIIDAGEDVRRANEFAERARIRQEERELALLDAKQRASPEAEVQRLRAELEQLKAAAAVGSSVPEQKTLGVTAEKPAADKKESTTPSEVSSDVKMSTADDQEFKQWQEEKKRKADEEAKRAEDARIEKIVNEKLAARLAAAAPAAAQAPAKAVTAADDSDSDDDDDAVGQQQAAKRVKTDAAQDAVVNEIRKEFEKCEETSKKLREDRIAFEANRQRMDGATAQKRVAKLAAREENLNALTKATVDWAAKRVLEIQKQTNGAVGVGADKLFEQLKARAALSTDDMAAARDTLVSVASSAHQHASAAATVSSLDRQLTEERAQRAKLEMELERQRLGSAAAERSVAQFDSHARRNVVPVASSNGNAAAQDKEMEDREAYAMRTPAAAFYLPRSFSRPGNIVEKLAATAEYKATASSLRSTETSDADVKTEEVKLVNMAPLNLNSVAQCVVAPERLAYASNKGLRLSFGPVGSGAVLTPPPPLVGYGGSLDPLHQKAHAKLMAVREEMTRNKSTKLYPGDHCETGLVFPQAN